MASMILAEVTANVSDFQQNPMATVATGHGLPVAILDHGQPLFYCIPAAVYESLLDRLEDLELNALADARLGDGQPIVKFGDTRVERNAMAGAGCREVW